MREIEREDRGNEKKKMKKKNEMVRRQITKEWWDKRMRGECINTTIVKRECRVEQRLFYHSRIKWPVLLV